MEISKNYENSFWCLSLWSGCFELQPLESLLFNIGGSYVGGCFVGNDLSNNDHKLEDYWLFDFGVNYELSEGASLFGGIDNLLNEEYLSTAYGTALYPGEGRKATRWLTLFLLGFFLSAFRAYPVEHYLKALYLESFGCLCWWGVFGGILGGQIVCHRIGRQNVPCPYHLPIRSGVVDRDSPRPQCGLIQ